MTTPSALDVLCEALDRVGCGPVRSGMARCPAHDDATASLSVAEGEHQPAVVHCHAGCDTDDVLNELGLKVADLSNEHRQQADSVTAIYDYTDERGELLYQKVRRPGKKFVQRRPAGNGVWTWNLGDTRRVLYNLVGVVKAIETGCLVWLTEGEKDADALQARLPAGEVATTMTDGAGRWRAEYTATLADAGAVMIVTDMDRHGIKHAREVAADLQRVGVETFVVQPRTGKDAFDHLTAGYGPDDFDPLAEEMPPSEALTDDPLRPTDDGGYSAEGGRLITVASVQPERVSWLWHGRLPLGKLVTLDGDPSLGKSTLMLDITARVTTGSPMPDGTSRGEPADVILMSAEDGIADTIRPRLDAAGADVGRVHVFDDVVYRDEQGQMQSRPPTIPQDIDELERLIRQVSATMVVVDVLNAFLGSAVDGYRDQDVRRVLHRLAIVADRNGVVIVVLRHMSKSAGGKAIYRGGGSIGIIGAARAGLIVACDPEQEDRRVLAVAKSNLAAVPLALAYQLVPDEKHGCARIAWLGTTAHTADQLVAPPDFGKQDGSDAASVLAEILADGSIWAKEAFGAMAEAGFSEDQAKRAKVKLRVRTIKVGKPGDADQGWMWALPEGSAKGAKGAAK